MAGQSAHPQRLLCPNGPEVARAMRKAAEMWQTLCQAQRPFVVWGGFLSALVSSAPFTQKEEAADGKP